MSFQNGVFKKILSNLFLIIVVLISFFIPHFCYGIQTFNIGGCNNVCAPCCNDDDCTGNCICVGAKNCVNNNGVFTGMPGECQAKTQVYICPLSQYTDVKELLNSIIKWVLYLSLAIAPLMVVLGGLLILFSGGDTSKTKRGKQIIIWAMVGLAIILAAKALSSVIFSILT